VRSRLPFLAPVLLAAAVLPAAPALAAPVEVTRFHTAETLARLHRQPVAVLAAPGSDPASLEQRLWLDAVARAVAAQGFAATAPASAPLLAEVRVFRDVSERRGGGGSPSVSVGVGAGSGGGWRGGSGVGLGVGLGLGLGGGGRRQQVVTELSVTFRDPATRAPLWEGRAVTEARAGSRGADPARTADRLARALFAGFPGRSGETIEVR
jgi:hypothetical protein